MKEIYDRTRELIVKGKAYVCECDGERMSKDRYESRECEHRGRSARENEELFDRMLNHKMEEGKAIVRFKGDMASQNTALRDPTILRIKNDAHYRQGTEYSVWPTYDINTPIMASSRWGLSPSCCQRAASLSLPFRRSCSSPT